LGNTASGNFSVVAGGESNSASNYFGTVSGGRMNDAPGDYGTVMGGSNNVASGRASTAAGGAGNVASGDRSFAAGSRAHAAHDYSFVWNGDTQGRTTSSLAEGDFVVYAPGRVRLFAGAWGTGGCEVGTVDFGGNLSCYGTITAAQFVTSSDRDLKSAMAPADVDQVLARVLSLPIAEWSFTDAPDVRHLGPTAQDFRAKFGLGNSERGIATVDADGVALAAIQGLSARLESREAALRAEVTAKGAEIEILKREIAALRQSVELLVARISGEAMSSVKP
jgi:hypothetical protein